MSHPQSAARRIFAPLILALLVLAGAFAFLAWLPLRYARDAWRHGRASDAIAMASRWAELGLWPRQYDQLLAASYLTTGQREAAEPYLAALRSEDGWVSILPHAEVAHRLFARRAYGDFLDYDTALHAPAGDDETTIYRAAAQLATKRVADAERTFRALRAGALHDAKWAALRHAFVARRAGSYPFVLDRHGNTIAMVDLASDDIRAINADFAALVEEDAGALTIEANARRIGVSETIETTLDAAIQEAAVAALAHHRGSLVAIDPRTNEILALASTPGAGRRANLALEQQYEPGAVMMVFTALDALESDVPVDARFPRRCNGVMQIDGRSFADSLPHGHGELPAFDAAMARSCDLVFADLGIRTGRARLRPFLSTIGFEGQANLGLFIAPLGRIGSPIRSDYETALAAIGFEHESVTTLHLAMLASMLANRGVLTTPRLYTARRSVLGEVIEQPPRQRSASVASAANVERVLRSMQAAVDREDGTAHAAAVDGMTVAIKTGTAGHAPAHDSLAIGITPVERPTVAFALVAEDEAPAADTAAQIAHDFVAGLEK